MGLLLCGVVVVRTSVGVSSGTCGLKPMTHVVCCLSQPVCNAKKADTTVYLDKKT